MGEPKPGTQIDLVSMDDWEAVYVDGILVDSHQDALRDWMGWELIKLGYTFQVHRGSVEDYEYEHLPEDLDDVLLDSGLTVEEERMIQAGMV